MEQQDLIVDVRLLRYAFNSVQIKTTLQPVPVNVQQIATCSDAAGYNRRKQRIQEIVERKHVAQGIADDDLRAQASKTI